MKAVVDKDLCIGCGVCEEECPAVFHMEEDGKATATEGVIPAENIDCANSAGEACPVEAIILE